MKAMIPIERSTQQLDKATQPSTEEMPMRPLILIIDDDAGTVDHLRNILSSDHDVEACTHCVQIFESCRARLPDVILLALNYPNTDGHEVCRQLKAQPLTRYTPIILLARQSDPHEEAKGIQAGAVDFMVLPSIPNVIRARIQTQLMLRRATKKMLAFNSTLEAEIVQRTSELKANMETLTEFREKLASSEAKATLSTLIASVSHELGTPMGNSVMTATYIATTSEKMRNGIIAGQIKRSELEIFMTETLDGARLMERNLARASDLIKSFNQVAADQASEQQRSFDLATAVKEIIATLAPSLKKKPHRIVVDIPADIRMDSLPGPLGQVVINLVNNAFLHAFEGRTDGVLAIAATVEMADVHLRFVDNGVGMSEDGLERLFQPFFSTKIGRGGTGLGMSIVQNLVEKLLKGSISVHSSLGTGTSFDIQLPLVLPEQEK